MSGIATAIVGGAIIGGVASNMAAGTQADAAESAAATSAASADQATALQKQMWEQQLADQAPWLQAGEGALNQLTAGTAPGGQFSQSFGMEQFQQDPGYAFRLSEGMKALDRSASASGNIASGSALKAATRYGQDMGSQEYQNAFNRYTGERAQQFNQLASLAGVGQTANQANAAAGQNYANAANNIGMTNAANQGNAMIAAGNANASSYAGWGNAISGGVNAFGQYMSQPQPQPQPRQSTIPASSYGSAGYSGNYSAADVYAGNSAGAANYNAMGNYGF